MSLSSGLSMSYSSSVCQFQTPLPGKCCAGELLFINLPLLGFRVFYRHGTVTERTVGGYVLCITELFIITGLEVVTFLLILLTHAYVGLSHLGLYCMTLCYI